MPPYTDARTWPKATIHDCYDCPCTPFNRGDTLDEAGLPSNAATAAAAPFGISAPTPRAPGIHKVQPRQVPPVGSGLNAVIMAMLVSSARSLWGFRKAAPASASP